MVLPALLEGRHERVEALFIDLKAEVDRDDLAVGRGRELQQFAVEPHDGEGPASSGATRPNRAVK